MPVRLFHLLPRGGGRGPTVSACADLLSRPRTPILADLTLDATLFLRPRVRPPGSTVDTWVADLEAAYLERLAKLPLVRWSPSASRLRLDYVSDMDEATLEEVTADAIRAVAAELVRQIDRLLPVLRRKRRGLQADLLFAELGQLADDLPRDDDALREQLGEHDDRSEFVRVERASLGGPMGEVRVLAEIRLYPGLRGCRPAVRRLLEGFQDDPTTYVSSAGPWLRLVAAGFERGLRERSFLLPGFRSIYLAPDSDVEAGSIRVYREGHDWVRWIEHGVALESLRTLCVGEPLEDTIEFVEKSLFELAVVYGLDSAPIEAVARDLMARGRAAFDGLEVGYPPMYNRRRGR